MKVIIRVHLLELPHRTNVEPAITPAVVSRRADHVSVRARCVGFAAVFAVRGVVTVVLVVEELFWGALRPTGSTNSFRDVACDILQLHEDFGLVLANGIRGRSEVDIRELWSAEVNVRTSSDEAL